ncbi:MAG TPA: hypothetical protein PK514_03080 [Spirochaetota bacterium]|nr:hypothetical protein [Spirochaetota bacterium]
MRLYRLTRLSAILPPLLMCGCLYGRVHPLAIEPGAKVMRSSAYQVLGEAEGASSSFTLLGIFNVTPGLDPERAVDQAIRSLGGDNLIECVYYSETRVYIVGVVNVVRVRGKVIRYLQ